MERRPRLTSFENRLLPRPFKMDLQNFDKLCSLCFFEFKLDSSKTGDVTKKIEKYLQIKMEYSWAGVCLNCYNSIEEFHEFYRTVHEAQKNYHEKYLIQRTNEQTKETIETGHKNQCSGDNITQNIRVSDAAAEEVKKVDQAKNVINDCKEEKINKTDDSKNYEEVPKPSEKLKEVCSEIEKKMLEFYNIKCEKCEDCKFTSFKMLGKHYMTIHNTQGYIKCCKRNIRVTDKYYLKSHMFKHLQPDTCRCNVCGKELSSLATLKHHMILHKPTEERPFQCNKCGKRFCCKNDLKNHEKAIHIPESEREDFICDVCGKAFQKVANLRYHHSSVHLQERKYICEICAKCFTTQSGLRTHINAAHLTLDPIQCHKCHKWLKTKDTFQKHLQLHQNNLYPCTHCTKVCNSSASLRSHLVKHSEERPHSCTVCGKSFKTKTHLKNHSAQHTGGSHHKCPYCSKLFANMSNYYTHRRRMHSREMANNQEGNKSEPNRILSHDCKTISEILPTG